MSAQARQTEEILELDITWTYDFPMDNRSWALVTGASGGIGLELARACVRDGWNVVMVGRDLLRLEGAALTLQEFGRQVRVHVCDLSLPGSAYALHSWTKEQGFDVGLLVNNAGVGESGELVANGPESTTRMVQLNVGSVVDLTRLYGADMVRARRGAILNVGSIAGIIPLPYFATYGATKAFVNTFTQAVGEELRPLGVKVTCLLPGLTPTGFGEASGMNPALFRSPVARSARKVARDGYRGLMAGRRWVVSGWYNAAWVFITRFYPRGIALRITGILLKKKG